ncbi:MAG: YSC84-related protein [Pseudomonadota bacterium]
MGNEFKNMSRRSVLVGAAAFGGLAACGNGVGSQGGAKIDARVDQAFNFMYTNIPGTQDLAQKAVGILMMPVISKVGLIGPGGSYGRGALRINGVTVDYYSATSATFGFQLGAQQYSNALFFMTEEALSDFRRSPGWTLGADAEYVISNEAGNVGVDTTTALSPVIAVVFGQAGLIAGATIEGNKYNRIIP